MNAAQPVIKNAFLAELLRPARLVFIINPKAGTRMQTRLRDSIDRFLNHRKFEYSIWHTEYAGHATELARKAVNEGYEIVVAVGGDGSVNEVAAGLMHSEVRLGIIPAGSGNGLAMHLGYGRNLDEAVRRLNSAEEKIIDCGIFNGRPFINVAGIGFDGLVSNLMKGKSHRGFLPYFFKSVKAGLEYTPKECVIEHPGGVIREKCFAISVANGPMYGYNVQIAPGAKLDDGLFSVVMLKQAPKWQYFAAMPSTLNGKILQESFVQHFSAARLTIKCPGDNYVHVDGEGLTMSGDLTFEVVPKAVRILVPQ